MDVFGEIAAIYLGFMIVATVICLCIVRINQSRPMDERNCWETISEWSNRHERSI
jgi:large-conductance mechanosensitive channel